MNESILPTIMRQGTIGADSEPEASNDDLEMFEKYRKQ